MEDNSLKINFQKRSATFWCSAIKVTKLKALNQANFGLYTLVTSSRLLAVTTLDKGAKKRHHSRYEQAPLKLHQKTKLTRNTNKILWDHKDMQISQKNS